MKTIQVATEPEPWIAIFAILFAVLCFWALLRLVMRFGQQTRTQSQCKWKRMTKKDGDTLKAWVCSSCNELAYSSTKKPPAQCKRDLAPRVL
jgi:hypothetical protein